MATLSAELVKRLARHGGTDQPVITLYLNVDGKENIRPEDYRHRLESMAKEALAKNPDDKNVADDLSHIVDYVTNEFTRDTSELVGGAAARGLAIFTSGDKLWEVVNLSLPVDDHLIVNRTPHVRHLEILLDEHKSTGVLLTDKQKARLLVIELGQVVERVELVDPLPRHDDDGGEWEKDHVRTHSNEMAHQHLRRAAHAMFEMYQRRHFDHLVVCVSEELKPELCKHLHDYLQQRMVGRSNLTINASDDDIFAAAYELTQTHERDVERDYVDRLRAGVQANEAAHRTSSNSIAAVAGLDRTLEAVFEKRVDTLLVSQGYAVEGWRCHDCNFIATVGRKCRMCGGSMTLVEDVIEEAVEDAIGQKCKVEFCSDNADLDVLGRIGALLRF